MPSGRTSSLGLDTNFIIGGHDDDSPLDTPDPPPGLFVLGSVPSIIRCWLSTDFSHSALLYADICTGAQKSILDFSLVKDLGLADQIQKDANGRQTIRLPVYLPEAVVTQPTSRSNSPAPQLPTLTADFEIINISQRNSSDRKKTIRVFIGSETLRSHNADILLSQNVMILYGDDRNKLSVPFVRPEDETSFKNLCTTNMLSERNELKATAAPFTPTESKPKAEVEPDTLTSALSNKLQTAKIRASEQDPRSASTAESQSPFTPVSMPEPVSTERALGIKPETLPPSSTISDSEKSHRAETAPTDPEPRNSYDSSRRESSGGIWGSWRQGPLTNTSGVENESTSGYQRATRGGGGRSMKVLKPSSKSISSAAPPVPGEFRRKSQAENIPLKWEAKRVPSVPRSENPVGGASAFAWMKPVGKKAGTAAGE